MARAKSTELRARLRSLVPKSELEGLARSAGFLQRSRLLDLPTFLFSLSIGASSGGDRSIRGLWEAYRMTARRRLSKTSFYDWLSKPAIVPWLREVIVDLVGKMAQDGGKLSGALGQFRDLFVVDSSQVTLPDRLRTVFGGTRSNSAPAAAKVHVVQRVCGSGLHSAFVTEGTANDSGAFRVGPWVRGGLLLFDLAYFNYRRFARIEKYKGFFISRLKAKVNPVIVRSLLNHRGKAVPVEGKKLKDVLPRLERKVIDFLVKVHPRDRKGARPIELRLVGIWNDIDRCYHLYLTNVRPEQLSATEIAEAYRLRWQVELLIRELKSSHGLDAVPGESPVIIEAMLYASIISALLTRRILRDLRRRLHLSPAQLTDEQGARIVQRFGSMLHLAIAAPAKLARTLARPLQTALEELARAYTTNRHNLTAELEDLRGREAVGMAMG